MKILIIEDEPKTAKDLKSTLAEINTEFIVLETFDSVESSVNYLIKSPKPDLIFMDIQLADGLSFEIFDRVKITSPVVFLTAFDEYALKAFKVNSIDYILKPFDKKALIASIDKLNLLAGHFAENDNKNARIEEIIKYFEKPKKSTFLVFSAGKYVPVILNEIAYFSIENSVTYINTYAGKKHISSNTLDEVEKSVDEKLFYRANRQYLISFESIKEIQHFVSRKLAVKLKVPVKESIIISKAKASHFLNWIETR